MKKKIGGLMLAVLVIGLFVMLPREISIKERVIAFSLVILLVAYIKLAIDLIDPDSSWKN